MRKPNRTTPTDDFGAGISGQVESQVSEPTAGDFQDFSSQLVFRDRLLRLLRAYFHASGFIEVQPPCLSRDCVVDAYLDPISIPASELRIGAGSLELEWNSGAAESAEESVDSQKGRALLRDSSARYYLQTSAESAMKRMLADGAPSIFAISPVFRSGEVGAKHNVEFTMLEWYEVGGNAASAIALLGNLAAAVFESSGYETETYRDAFGRILGLDPIECDVEKFAALVGDIDTDLAASMATDRDSLLDVLLTHRVEKHLGTDTPVILTRYPVTQAALARPCEDDSRFAHRFELFYRGVELANGYDELRDWKELVRRYEINNEIRRRSGRDALPVETTLVEAMRRGLPACSGVAVGVDRLQMLQTGARSIEEVIPLHSRIA